MGNDQLAARRRQVGVDARVRFHDVGQTQLEVSGNLLQRTVVRGTMLLILADQAAVRGGQHVFNGGRLLADQGQRTKRAEAAMRRGFIKFLYGFLFLWAFGLLIPRLVL